MSKFIRNFAKVFTLEEADVLITKTYSDESDAFEIVQRADAKAGYEIKFSIGFDNETSRDRAFDNYNEQSAERFLKEVGRFL